MNLFETIKAAVPVRQAAEHYGLKVSRYGHIWTGHHKRNSERISEIADFSLIGEVGMPYDVLFSPYHKQNIWRILSK